MLTKDRVIHTLLFEFFALILMVVIGMLVTNVGMEKMTGLAVVMSLLAMMWNYFYNIIFDNKFGEDRINRSLTMRVMHGIGFEGGLVAVTLPLIMWWLDLDFLTAFMLDFGAVLFFLVYAIIFNWLYDITRHRFFISP